MRVFIGSSGEQKQLVEWLSGYMLKEYGGTLEPVPWTGRWPGGRYTLENLMHFVEDTDASILFWTPDDRTWYRETDLIKPRDNLIFEAGLFIAAHGMARTQIMVPRYTKGDLRGDQGVPTDVAGLTLNLYDWKDGPADATGLPYAARNVCDSLQALRPRFRTPSRFEDLSKQSTLEKIETFVGEWSTLHSEGIQRFAKNPIAKSIDLLAAYRVGEIKRPLEELWKSEEGRTVRVCFANMWDEELLQAYQRKFHDRDATHIQNAVIESIKSLLGPCDVIWVDGKITITNVARPPRAKYEIRLTSQRITYSYYRVDDTAFLVPLDMKLAQNPAPLVWTLAKEAGPRAFDHYLREYETMFSEAIQIYPSR